MTGRDQMQHRLMGSGKLKNFVEGDHIVVPTVDDRQLTCVWLRPGLRIAGHAQSRCHKKQADRLDNPGCHSYHVTTHAGTDQHHGAVDSPDVLDQAARSQVRVAGVTVITTEDREPSKCGNCGRQFAAGELRTTWTESRMPHWATQVGLRGSAN